MNSNDEIKRKGKKLNEVLKQGQTHQTEGGLGLISFFCCCLLT